MPVRQILSTPTLFEFGCYDYCHLSLDQAIEWLSRGEYFSTLRSSVMCRALHQLTGRSIYPLYGVPNPPLDQGEEALVYYVSLSETVRNVTSMTLEYMLSNYSLGLLKRVDVAPQGEHQKETSEKSVDMSILRLSRKSRANNYVGLSHQAALDCEQKGEQQSHQTP